MNTITFLINNEDHVNIMTEQVKVSIRPSRLIAYKISSTDNKRDTS